MALSLLFAGSARAGQAFFDFNTDPSTSGLLTNYGNAVWSSTDGAGVATNINDGFLQITAAANGQGSQILFSDFDNGAVVKAFTFEADVRIGNGTQNPADGFSVNYARANDPTVLAAEAGGSPTGWATGPNCEANLPEEGTQTGIAIGFDAWNSGGSAPYCDGLGNAAPGNIGPDIIGISVRVDGMLVTQVPMPTQNGSVTDPTSLQTGPWTGDSSTTPLGWAHFKIVLDVDGKLTVVWKGATILNAYQTAYFPSPGRLVFAGRTGNSNQNQDIDNISITTIPAALAQVGTVTPFVDGFSIDVSDSGASVIDTTREISAKLNGNTVTPTATKTGGTTTVAYHSFPVLLPSGSSNYVQVSLFDTNNNVITGARSFTVPAYKTVPASDAVTGVDTSKSGFKMLPWQSGGEPNTVYWMLEQLAGLHGANNADLTTATDGGYIDWTGLVNFDIGGGNGHFTTATGYPDSPFPGIPGANAITDNTAENIVTYLQFQNPGVYTMVVNSDDGFLVSEGHNPSDWFAQGLGSFNGGRGASDTIFTFVVTNAGFYPFRLAWENGGGGANCEWFTIKDGIRYLVNDPDPTNTTGIKAFYAGPGLPAYVSAVQPNPGSAGALPDSVLVQLTDGGGSTVSGTPKLYLNGTLTSPTINNAGAVHSVQLTLPYTSLMPVGSNFAAVVWSDSVGNNHSNTWTFSVAAYATLDPSQATPVGTQDQSKPGFLLHVAQIDFSIVNDSGDGIANQVDEANDMIDGLFFPWYGTNVADPTDAANGSLNPAQSDHTWFWSNQVDFAVNGSAGDFNFNYTLPGIKGVTALDNNFAARFQGYLVFPNPGFYRMGISSDDGYRVSEGFNISRHVLHVTGSGGINQDVGVVVSKKSDGNGGFGGELPVTPISGPVVFISSNTAPVPSAINLTGKIAVMDLNLYGLSDQDQSYFAQTNGAIGVIIINTPNNGFPYTMTGTPPGPVNIPALNVNGFGGQRDFWVTNSGLSATIGASQAIQLGSADYGKGMGWVDFGFVVPQAGVYPINVIYEQGGGGAGIEWATIQSDGTRVLVNDNTAAGSLMAYRAVTVAARPSLSIGRSGSTVTITYTGTLQSSSTVNGTYTDVGGATSPYTVPGGGPAMQFYRSRN